MAMSEAGTGYQADLACQRSGADRVEGVVSTRRPDCGRVEKEDLVRIANCRA